MAQDIPSGDAVLRNVHLGPAATGDNLDALKVAMYQFDGTGWTRQRSPTTFKSVSTVASGTTVIWTPTTGKKFRIMGYDMQITANATLAVAGILSVSLLDGATDINMTHDLYVPSAIGQANFDYDTGWHVFGNGYLSTTTNNTLYLNLSKALVTGSIRVNVMGNEEG